MTGLFISNYSYSQNKDFENPNNIPVKKTTKKSTNKEIPKEVEASEENGIDSPFLKHAFALGFGQSYLFGDFSDLGEDKVVMEFFYLYRASYTFQFQLNVHSHEFNLNNQSIRLSSTNAAIKAKLYDFDAFAPYILGGLGLYWPTAKRMINNQLRTTDSSTSMGINLGTGMDLYLNKKIAAGFLIHYHYPFREKFDNQPSLEGHYMKLLITFTYSFL